MDKFQAVLVVMVVEDPLVLVRRVEGGEICGVFSAEMRAGTSLDLTKCPANLVAEMPSMLRDDLASIQFFDVLDWENRKVNMTIHFRIWALRLSRDEFRVRFLHRAPSGNEPRLAWLNEPRRLNPGEFLPGHWDVVKHVLDQKK